MPDQSKVQSPKSKVAGRSATPRAKALFLASLLLLPLLVRGQAGALDTSFDPGPGVDRQVYAIAVQTNGAILLAGDFTRFNNAPRTNIARLTAAGGLDTLFDPGRGVGGAFPYLNTVALQASGKVLLGGSFASVGPAARANLARIEPTGAINAGFFDGTDDTVNALAVQPNGAVLVGGFFTQAGGAAHSAIARFGVDGIVELGFNPVLTGDPFPTIFALALQTDGKVVLGGSFTNVNSTPTTNLTRLNSNGTLDLTFHPLSVSGGQLSSAVYALAVDGQGRILLGGDFTSVNGQARTNLARLNPNGTLDNQFSPLAGTDFAVNTMLAQSDGKLLLGGFFTTVNGIARNYVARLNADGTLDRDFDPGAGADAVVYALGQQADGKVLVGGGFRTFDNRPRGGIARLLNNLGVPAPNLSNPAWVNGVFMISVATVSGSSYALQYKDSLADANWTTLAPVAGDGTTKTLTDSGAAGAHRFYRVQVQ